MSNNTRKFAIGAIIAGAAGYIAGILTAPKSGKETREDIITAATKARMEGERKLKLILADLASRIEDARTLSAKIRGKGQQELEALIKSANDAKEKAREVLSAIHEGHAEDVELDKAINEAQSALSHLTNYLKKDVKDQADR